VDKGDTEKAAFLKKLVGKMKSDIARTDPLILKVIRLR